MNSTTPNTRGGDLHPEIAAVLEGRSRFAVVCADNAEILPTLGDRSVASILTDPPYAKVVVNTSKSGPASRIGLAERRDLGYAGISDADRIALGLQFGRIPSRWGVIFCDAESLTAWRVAVEGGGLRHIRMGAWVAPNPTPQFTGDRPGTGWEAAEIAHAPGRCRWNGGGRPAVWVHNRPVNGTPERTEIGHPTPKPVPLMLELVSLFTDPGEVVLDPFCGSGTTLLAAIRLGRRAIGIEKDPRYAQIARERLAAEERGLSLRDARAGQIGLFEGVR